MKKFLYLSLTLILVIIFTSGKGTFTSDSRVGKRAVNFTVGNDSVVVTLDQFKGKFVVMNVWSSADAVSRIENIELSKLAEGKENLVHMAINFDRSKPLFKEVIAADSINPSSQFYCERQDRARFESNWEAGEKACTFLINRDGLIIAVNPTTEDILGAIK